MGFLKNTGVLWGLFVATIGLSVGFAMWAPAVGDSILDMLSEVDDVKGLLANMSDAQKAAHFRMTTLLDIPFPIVSGGLFAGMAWRFFGKAGFLLALPAFVFIPADLLENTIQLMALKGDESLLGVKALVTPVKTWLFLIAAVLALVATLIAVFRAIRGLFRKA